MKKAGEERPGPDFPRGFGLAIGIFALSSLLLLLPPVGPVLLATFAPFLAGYYGARAGAENVLSGWLPMGVLPALLWSAVEIGLLLALLGSFLGAADPFEPVGLSLLAALSASNVVFCVLGARRGAAARHGG